MQPLEWWVSSSMKKGVPVSEEDAYAGKFNDGKIFIVENRDEADLAKALQFIYGHDINLIIRTRVSLQDINEFLSAFSRVYTSWDPLDSQR